MDARGRLDQIRQWATEAEKRSGSAYVDERQQWIRAACDELAEFAAGVPNVIERRVGERRNVDRPDSEHPMRRVGGNRRALKLASDSTIATATNALILTSTPPPGMVATNTYQLSWEYRNIYTGDVKSGPTPTFSTTDAGVATVSVDGLITAVGAGSATISGVGNGLPIVNPVTVTVSGSLTPDGVTANPTSYDDVVGNTLAPLQFTLTDTGTPVTGRTPTAVSNNTGVVTLGAINSTQDPLHIVQPTLVGAGTTTITLGDSVVGNLGTVNVTASASGGAAPWLQNNFSQYADINAVYLDGGAGKTWTTALTVSPTAGNQNGGEWQGAVRMSLGTDGGPAGGSSNYLRFTWPVQANPICTDVAITTNVRFPSNQTELWVEWWDRYNTEWQNAYKDLTGTCISTNGHKHFFIRCNASRFNFQTMMGSAGRCMVGYPGPEQGPHTGPNVSQVADGNWNHWQAHGKLGASGIAVVYRNGVLVYDWGTVSITAATSMTGISFGRTLNQQGAHPTVPLIMDVGMYKVYITNPGWGF